MSPVRRDLGKLIPRKVLAYLLAVFQSQNLEPNISSNLKSSIKTNQNVTFFRFMPNKISVAILFD